MLTGGPRIQDMALSKRLRRVRPAGTMGILQEPTAVACSLPQT